MYSITPNLDYKFWYNSDVDSPTAGARVSHILRGYCGDSFEVSYVDVPSNSILRDAWYVRISLGSLDSLGSQIIAFFTVVPRQSVKSDHNTIYNMRRKTRPTTMFQYCIPFFIGKYPRAVFFWNKKWVKRPLSPLAI